MDTETLSLRRPLSALAQALARGALPALDPIDDMGMDYDKALVAKTNRLRKLQARLRQHPVHRAAEDPAWEYRPSFEHGLALELAEGAAEQDEQEAPSKACVVM